MKKPSQLQKIIYALIIFILLMQLSGCFSSKIISSSDLPLSKSNEYTFISHSGKVKYLLENTVISNGIFSGKIDTVGQHMGGKISVYLSSDTMMKINKEHILSIPLDGIAVVEIAKIEAGKTILLVTGCAAGVLIGGCLAIIAIVTIGGGI